MTHKILPKLAIAGILATLLGLTGCAGNMSGIGGSSEFHCPAPQGIPCRSVSEVDQAVRTGRLSSTSLSRSPEEQQGANAPLHGGDNRESPGRSSDTSLPSRSTLPRYLPASATLGEDEPSLGAIRSEPTVIRIWVAPYEDSDGDLHEASRVYLQIDNGRWLIQHNQDRIKREFAPKAARATAAAVQAPMQTQQAPIARTAAATSSTAEQAIAAGMKNASTAGEAHVR